MNPACIYPYCENSPTDPETGACLAHSVAVGGIYRHFKGALYTVIAVARHSERDEQYLVVYRSTKDDRVWARPLESFLSFTEAGVKRFEPVSRGASQE